MRGHAFFRARVAVGLVLAAWFLVVGPGCAGGSGLEGGRTSCGRGGGGGDSTPDPVPLSRYVGTWSGSWSELDDPNDPVPILQGEMTLTVDATGAFSGQLTETASGQTGSVSGTIRASGAYGSADINAVFGERSLVTTQAITFKENGHLSGNLALPLDRLPKPGDPPPLITTYASFDLSRQ
jgi:hypothetical protein